MPVTSLRIGALLVATSFLAGHAPVARINADPSSTPELSPAETARRGPLVLEFGTA